MEDKKERGDGRKKGKRKIDAPARARATLNILMAQYRRQCYRGRSVYARTTARANGKAPLFPPFPSLFFSIAVQYPNWFARQCNRAPQTTPIATLSTHARTRLARKPRCDGRRISKRNGFGGEAIDPFSPPSLDRVFDSFSGTHSPSSLRDGRGTIAWKSVSPPPPPFCSVENFPSFLLLSFFFRMDFQSKSSRLISLWGNQLRYRK